MLTRESRTEAYWFYFSTMPRFVASMAGMYFAPMFLLVLVVSEFRTVFQLTVVLFTVALSSLGFGLFMWFFLGKGRAESLKQRRNAHDQVEASRHMFAFDARYEPASSASAERAFVLRSWRDLRRPNLIAIPGLLVLGLVASRFAPDSVAAYACYALFGLSVVQPILFYFLRSSAAANQARKYPVRSIRLSDDGCSVSTPDGSKFLPWLKVVCVWHAADHLLLVVGPFGALAIPNASLPPGAEGFIESALARQ